MSETPKTPRCYSQVDRRDTPVNCTCTVESDPQPCGDRCICTGRTLFDLHISPNSSPFYLKPMPDCCLWKYPRVDRLLFCTWYLPYSDKTISLNETQWQHAVDINTHTGHLSHSPVCHYTQQWSCHEITNF